MTHYRYLAPEVETRAEDGGAVTRIVASTETPDRMGDVVEQTWELSRYRRNPVALWAHDPATPPVGRTVELEVRADGSDRALVASIEWDTGEDNPLGRTVAGLFSRGMLSAVSVGFVPGERVSRAELPEEHPAHMGAGDGRPGYLLRRNELLEISAVSIPANPDALVVGRAVSVDVDRDDIARTVERAVERVLRETLPRRQRAEVVDAIRADVQVRAAIEGIVLAALHEQEDPLARTLERLQVDPAPKADGTTPDWFRALPDR